MALSFMSLWSHLCFCFSEFELLLWLWKYMYAWLRASLYHIFSCKTRQAYNFFLWLHITVSSFISECPFKTNYGTKVIVPWDTGHNICIWRCNYSKFSNQSYLTIKHNYDLTAWNVVNNYFLLLQCCWQAQ